MSDDKIMKVWNMMLWTQWCATNNYANIFSKAMDFLLCSDKLSHNDLLNLIVPFQFIGTKAQSSLNNVLPSFHKRIMRKDLTFKEN